MPVVQSVVIVILNIVQVVVYLNCIQCFLFIGLADILNKSTKYITKRIGVS